VLRIQLVDDAIDVGFGHYDLPVRLLIVLLCGLILVTPWPQARGAVVDRLSWLGAAERVADGVDLFRIDGEQAFVAPGELERPPLPRSVRLLRLDPARVLLASALAGSEVPARATVLDIARRRRAIAAVNAGFFAPTGDPNGLLKIDGRLLSDTGRARGAVALFDRAGRLDGHFDQVSVRVRLRFRNGAQWRTVRVDGVDTIRGAGRLALYTPASGASTDTRGGLEWTIDGTPLRVTRTKANGNAAIPPTGYVLSYGGSAAPPPLAGLTRAPSIQVRETLMVRSGRHVRDWTRAGTLVGGAGLLLQEGKPLRDWAVERLSRGFETTPHPRTVIARDGLGFWWLITIDGRQPGHAVGMSFPEMQVLLARLGATDALNLDGGGSTTMVVRGELMNRPSDLTGPRPVSDALVVTAR
jgi:hypothetical protein